MLEKMLEKNYYISNRAVLPIGIEKDSKNFKTQINIGKLFKWNTNNEKKKNNKNAKFGWNDFICLQIRCGLIELVNGKWYEIH